MCKAKTVSYWEEKLRGEAALLPSLVYFQPCYMSLTTPHPLWTMAESGYEVTKANSVATMLSGRYATDYHARHWSRTNPQGLFHLCLAVSFPGQVSPLGTLYCPALAGTRNKSTSIGKNICWTNPISPLSSPTTPRPLVCMVRNSTCSYCLTPLPVQWLLQLHRH